MKITPKNMTLYRHLFVISTAAERNCWAVEDVEKRRKQWQALEGGELRRGIDEAYWLVQYYVTLTTLSSQFYEIECEILENLINLLSKVMREFGKCQNLSQVGCNHIN